ncbi:MAG TPA: N-acetylmuramoyl-L-alanine amidase, partial [Leptospiraceae bacterium]|nr:N-acetylmuramoyl-L-alanine amidase [Leptospiraceae bacterium]
MHRPIVFFLASFFAGCLPLFAFPDEIPVVMDPGHGGAIVPRKDDKWDPVTRQYLDFYLSGMMYNQYTEQEIVLDLSKKVRKYLELTRSDDGWLEFEKILRLFSDQ